MLAKTHSDPKSSRSPTIYRSIAAKKLKQLRFASHAKQRIWCWLFDGSAQRCSTLPNFLTELGNSGLSGASGWLLKLIKKFMIKKSMLKKTILRKHQNQLQNLPTSAYHYCRNPNILIDVSSKINISVGFLNRHIIPSTDELQPVQIERQENKWSRLISSRFLPILIGML